MSRYIDIEPYEKDGWYLQKHYRNSYGEVIKTTPLVSVPTARDAEIIRCKDCLYYVPEVDEPHKPTCQRLWGGMTECEADSYCSDGVRKDEVEE